MAFLRGGGWSEVDVSWVRVMNRESWTPRIQYAPSTRDNCVGFRCFLPMRKSQ